MPTSEAVRDAAIEAWDAGLCVVPPREDGSKAPNAVWKEFQTERPTRERIEQYYAVPRHGLGLLGGPVSGELEVVDIESREMYEKVRQGVADAGLDEVVERVESGYLERCPRGGVHWLWKTAKAGGNHKLALTEDRETLIEVKASGGFIITAPSHGPVHPSGLPYERLGGSFDTVQRIGQEDRNAVLEALKKFDRSPRHPERPEVRYWPEPSGTRPGDDFNHRGDWEVVLGTAGWTRVGVIGVDEYWKRPDKTDPGHSAVLHTDSSIFVPFSTSTPFPHMEEGYGLFSTYAWLHHDGDFRAAASALRAEGYGKERKLWTPAPEGSMRGCDVLSLQIPQMDTLPVLGRKGLVLEQGTNLLYSYPKVGKTEFVRHLVQEWLQDGRTVLYLTEEELWFWTHRLQLYDHPADLWGGVVFCPAFGWGIKEVYQYLEGLEETFDVVVVDTLRNCVGYQEGDGDKSVNTTIQPLIAATRGSTLICLYHARKMPGEGGRDISGHHALFGVFDRRIQLKEMSGEGNEDKRILKVSGRLLGPDATTSLHFMMTKDQHFKALDVQQIKEEVRERYCKECDRELEGRQRRFCSDTCRKRYERRQDQDGA